MPEETATAPTGTTGAAVGRGDGEGSALGDDVGCAVAGVDDGLDGAALGGGGLDGAADGGTPVRSGSEDGGANAMPLGRAAEVTLPLATTANRFEARSYVRSPPTFAIEVTPIALPVSSTTTMRPSRPSDPRRTANPPSGSVVNAAGVPGMRSGAGAPSPAKCRIA